MEAWAAGLNEARLLCRTLGHAPLPSSVTIVAAEGSNRTYYEQTLRCRNRCGCWWTQLIDTRTGEQLRRQLHYPPGYLAIGIGRINGDKKNIVRLEDARRRYEKGSN